MENVLVRKRAEWFNENAKGTKKNQEWRRGGREDRCPISEELRIANMDRAIRAGGKPLMIDDLPRFQARRK